MGSYVETGMPGLESTGQELWSLRYEFLMYVLIILLLLMVILFFKYSRILRKVSTKTACYRDYAASLEPAVYQVSAKYMNVPVFDITYDTRKRKQEINCTCPPGDKKGTFKSIPYYDMAKSTPKELRVRYANDLVCECEKTLDATANDTRMIFTGEPGIVGFMYDQKNTGFFDNIFLGSNPEYRTTK